VIHDEPRSLRRLALRVAAELIVPRPLLVRRAPSAGRKIALTFDDGPDPMTGAYLDTLDRLGVRATFFLVGKTCLERRDDLLAILARGHEVASHGYAHLRFPELSRAEIRAELDRTAAVLPPTMRARPMVRPPGGLISLPSLAACAWAGYQVVLWSLDSRDARTRDPGEVAACLAPERMRPGDIVLLHEGSPWTLAALPDAIARLRDAGWEMATVSELLDGK
jgi:peptidoglycan/xylan/chitin deacetylase (PgdA/CDA1 family)